MLKNLFATALLITWSFAQSTQAGVMYDFSYDWGGGQSIVGQLEGDLQGDGDTIHVTDVLANIFTPGGPYTADTGADYFVDRNAGTTHDTFGIVSLSGFVMDFVLHRGSHGGSCGYVDSVCLFSSSSWVGGRNTGFSPDNWRIASSVPEPATLGLLGLSLLGMGVARKYRRLS